jgi:HEAT repeat protein
MNIPAPTVGGVRGPTHAATLIWSFEEDVVPRLIELVNKERAELPAAYEDALLAIAYTADSRAVPALAELLGQPDSETNHMLVIAALGEIKDASAVSAVLARATDSSATIATRGAALVALGQMGAVEAIPTLLAGTGPTEDSMLRMSAISGLGHLGDRLSAPAIAALAQLARGTDERLALNAIHSLRSAGSTAARTALAALQQNAATPTAQSAARDATTRLA